VKAPANPVKAPLAPLKPPPVPLNAPPPPTLPPLHVHLLVRLLQLQLPMPE